MSPSPVLRPLSELRAQGALRDIDFFLADALHRCSGEQDGSVLLAAAMASHVVTGGHICLDLAGVAGTLWPASPLPDTVADGQRDAAVELPPLDRWVAALSASPLCDTPDDASPLVLVQGARPRLYLRRYYHYERRIAGQLRMLAEPVAAPGPGPASDTMIDTLFPAAADGSHEGPRAAAMASLERRLLIISGGPGTGKTHTLARLLVLLVAAGMEADDNCVIRMAAPTGKAAMRMRESIRASKAELDLDDALAQRIPEDASTLHRLLGTRPHSPHFRHNAENPVKADIVIVDEASMIDLPLMAKLLDALQPGARLILLGDMHQLSSVEPGYVLGDICSAALTPGSPLAGSMIELTHSWRFPVDGPVGRLGTSLRAAGGDEDPDGAAAWATLQDIQGPSSSSGDAVRWYDPPEFLRTGDGHPVEGLRQLVLENVGPFLDATDVADAFDALSRFRVLCATRHGPRGVLAVNSLVERILSTRPGADRRLAPSGPYYDHRVIMVTRNDYGLRLFNGDIGIILPAPDAEGRNGKLAAWFDVTDDATGERSFRSLPCHMLPAHETAFAMTIHKSQGSQFRDILVVLPGRGNRLLTKELIYTGLTRAQKRVWLWCSREAFIEAATHKTVRSSGLAEALL